MLHNVIYDAEQAMQQYLEQRGTQVNAQDIGLDPRAGTVWVTDDAIVARSWNVRSLEYYGGFEYVDSDYKTQMGEYTIYFADDERVEGCLECYSELTQAA